ncbi:MAG: CRISPR-associated endonuclease Cas3'' [Oscillospiraceae bacterium]|nr:MAG: CRISPR-associated endonuclease Cas3'' [Oscillospiraceae bacterium]
MSFPAHINKDGIVQTVAQHCRNTAEIARKNLCRLGLADTAYLAGLLHDAGKCTDEFSNYIQKAALGEHVCRGSVIHTFAAVRFLLNTYHSAAEPEDDAIKNAAAEILSCAIGGHHGLFDCFDENKSCGFTHRIGKQPEYDDRAMQGFFKEISGRECIDGLFSSSVQEISSKIQQISAISNARKKRSFILRCLHGLLPRL